MLKVDKLKTYFYTEAGTIPAVDGVSFEVGEQETLCIVGESGSGKSVTAMSIIGLIQRPPGKFEEGEVVFQDKDLLKVDEKTLRKIRGNEISMIFQEPMTSLNPVFTVGNQLMEPILLQKNVNKRQAYNLAVELLEKVGISNPDRHMKSYPHELSGGMRQRIMIAIAMSSTPKLLIADEPTTALDVTIQAQILDLMRKMKEDFGTSILLITHDLGVVAEMADRVVVMYLGKIMEQGSVKDIFDNPMHPYTQGLQASIPQLDSSRHDPLYVIEGQVPDYMNLPPGCAFEPRCPKSIEICRHQVPDVFSLDACGKRLCACWLVEEEAVHGKDS